MKKSLLFKKIANYWLSFLIVYTLGVAIFSVGGNVIFLAFNLVGIGLMTYLENYHLVKEDNDYTGIPKMLKTYLFLYIAFVFLATSLFRGHNILRDFRNVWHAEVNLVPVINTFKDLKASFNEGNYDSLSLLIGNFLLLTPLTYLYAKNIKKNNFFKTTGACFLTAIILETFQFLCGVGVFDIDDIILNTMGPIVFYPLFNKSALTRVLDNIFNFKHEKISKRDYIFSLLIAIPFLILCFLLVYDYFFRPAGFEWKVVKETPCDNIKTYAFDSEYYNYYYVCSNNDDLYLEYRSEFLWFHPTTRYLIKDIIANPSLDNRFSASRLDDEYFIKESKYEDLVLETNYSPDDISYDLDNDNISLKIHSRAINVDNAEENYYFVIPKNEGKTMITFKIEKSGVIEYQKYEVTTTKDLKVITSKIK